MARPLSISRDDLKNWADRFDSPGKLPVLVRRLLLATTPITAIDMRGDGGTRLGGWDGEVMSQRESAFCPFGLSVWELSVRDDVKTKLDEDFDKRTKTPNLPVDPKRVTYVAVTARSFDKKKAWAKEKKAKGHWADVRVYDVDDLATWLEQAPAVATWFGASEFGRLTHEIRTVEEFLHEFSHDFMPPLPATILLSGEERSRQSRDLLAGLVKTDEYLGNLRAGNKAPMRTWKVSAESAEEALLFIAATLSASGNEAASLRERTLIVDNQDAFRACLHAQSREPLLLLPRFSYAIPAKAVGHRVQAVLPVSWDEKIGIGEGARLDLIPHFPLETALKAAGFDDAGRWAREADGRLSKLRVLLMSTSYGRRTSTVSAEQIALLLVGAWKPTQEADREVIRRLGADPDKAERLCGVLSLGDDPLLEAEHDERVGTIYRLVAPRAAWKTMGRDVTQSDLNRFFQVAQDVLARTSTATEEGEWTTPQSPIEREIGSPSGALHAGVAASIAWLAIADDEGYLEPTHRRGHGSELAAALIRILLPTDSLMWRSHLSILRELAEAAPEQFLESLSQSLQKGPDAIGGGSRDLLWALETLAWNDDLLFRVVSLLAEIDGQDKEREKHADGAFRSLGEILHPILPQSKTSAEQRIDLFRRLFERHENVAWRLAISQLSSLNDGGFLIPTPRPQYRRWVNDDEKNTATYGDLREQANALIEMVIERAGTNPSRWAELVALPHDTLGWRILDALTEAYPTIIDHDAVLWDAVRKKLSYVAWAIGLKNDAERESRDDFERMRERLLPLYRTEPPDLVLRHRWLFDGGDQLPEPVPGGDDANDEKRKELIQSAILDFRDLPDRWKLLERLASSVKQPGILGQALAACSYVDDVEQALLVDPPLLNLGPCLAFFWAWRRDTKGWEWFESFLRTLVEHSRVDDATNVLLLFRATEDIWDLVDRIKDPLRSTYWKKHEPLWFDTLSLASYERGISYLLEAGRARTAVEAARRAIHYEKIGPTTVLRVLGALRDASNDEDQKGLAHHEVEALFGELDKHPEVGEDQIIELEIALAEQLDFPPFDAYKTRGARCFYAKLNRSPEYFVEVLRRMQHPEGVDIMDEIFGKLEDAAAIERQQLRRLIHNWRSFPGAELPIAEREVTLEAWCNDVFRLAGELTKDAGYYLEIMLAHVDPAEDGHWPCVAARNLIESGKIHADSLSTAAFNGRGLQLRGLGERKTPLRVLADQYERSAKALRGKYPVTAEMLREMAKNRKKEAARVEAEERREHIEWGEREKDPEASAEELREHIESGERMSKTEATQSHETRSGDQTHRSGLNHILRIHVENLRCFDSLTIDGIPVDEERGQCLILLGANGTGKTTLLRAIAAALLDEQAAGGGINSIKNNLLLLRNQNASGNVKVTLGHDEYGVEFVPDGAKLGVRTLGKPPSSRPWVVGYGCFRGSLLDGDENAMAPAGDTATLWRGGMNLWPSLESLRDLGKGSKSGDSESQILADGTRNALRQILHDIDDVSVESERLLLGGKGVGGKHPAEALSDGYLGMMGWVLDMIFRWVARARTLHARGLGDPISINFLEKMEGVALVDDIDLHLHPKWQRRFLKNLQDTFPRMTFVGTTHNPQTILGVHKPNQIHVLRRSFENPEQVEVRAVDVPVGRRAHEVLTGPWFDLDSTLDDETLDLMDEHQRLLLQPVRDKEAIARLQEQISLRISRFVDTSREAYVYGIVTEILSERFPKLQPEDREKARQQIKNMVKERIAEEESNKP